MMTGKEVENLSSWTQSLRTKQERLNSPESIGKEVRTKKGLEKRRR